MVAFLKLNVVISPLPHVALLFYLTVVFFQNTINWPMQNKIYSDTERHVQSVTCFMLTAITGWSWIVGKSLWKLHNILCCRSGIRLKSAMWWVQNHQDIFISSYSYFPMHKWQCKSIKSRWILNLLFTMCVLVHRELSLLTPCGNVLSPFYIWWTFPSYSYSLLALPSSSLHALTLLPTCLHILQRFFCLHILSTGNGDDAELTSLSDDDHQAPLIPFNLNP